MAIWNFTTVDYAPGSFDGLSGINDNGNLVGNRDSGLAPHAGTAFVGTQRAGFTDILVLGSAFTSVGKISNNGTIIGSYHNGSNAATFLDKNGKVTIPSLPVGSVGTGINDYGAFVGSLGGQGFLDQNGRFSTFTVPGSISTMATDINDSGRIVGDYTSSDDKEHGFYGTPGHFKTLDVPGAIDTTIYGENNLGDMVGRYVDASGNAHGFVDKNGQITTLSAPGATFTAAYGINDSREIVGEYRSAAGTHGFIASSGHWPV